MSELETKNVFAVDPGAIADLYERKVVVAMRATALLVDGSEDAVAANAELIQLSDQLGVAPTVTYEDLIFRNPLPRGQAYVMSTEQPQIEHEVMFYAAHREIESHLADVITALHEAPEASLQHMDNAVARQTALRRQLSAEAFAAFRPYFVGLNGHAGPSGLFSAAIPIIDLLVHGGRNIDQAERERMLRDARAGLYPSHQTEELTGLLLHGQPLKLEPTVVSGLVRGLNDFRKVHRGSVRKFVLGALDSEAAGTGGVTNVSDYLEGKIIHAKEKSDE